MYAQSFPALNNDVVTQGHTNYCLNNGHATHSVDGVTSPFCPRCGERNAPAVDTYYGRELGDVVTDRNGGTWVIAYTVASDGTRAGTVYMAHVMHDGERLSDSAYTVRAEALVNN